MKIEIHLNGRQNIQLSPEDDVERLILRGMQDSATKGKAVRLEMLSGSEDTFVVSVEK